MRALVAGWFSFADMGATAGDVMARDVLLAWLREAGMPYDVAVAPPFTGGLAWADADPAAYSHVAFVCGPFGNGWPVVEFLERFGQCMLVGVDLSMLQPLSEWNPFAALIERDSDRRSHPDLAFVAASSRVPVVGLCLVHPQAEYKHRGRHDQVNDALQRLVARHDVAVVRIDTRLDSNSGGLRSAPQIESLIARTDAVVTTRLHGLVLSLKNGVPALAVDPIEGGAKITAQAATVDWPFAFQGSTVTDDELDRALRVCLSAEGRHAAARSAGHARTRLEKVRDEVLAAFSLTSKV